MTVDTIIEDDAWTAVSVDAVAKRAVTVTLEHVGLDPEEWEVSVLACNDARIAD